MRSPAIFARLILPESLRATSMEANGSGWSLTYNCLVCSSTVDSIPHITDDPLSAPAHSSTSLQNITNGFLLRLHTSQVLDPLYMERPLFLLDSTFDLLHFPPKHFSSFPIVQDFVLSTLHRFGVPTTDPDPLARLIFSFALQHEQTSAAAVVSLYISFTVTTVLRNHAEAVDWVHGGTPQSQIVRTLRSSCEAVAKLKDASFDGSLSRSESCMVCLEGFNNHEDGRLVSRLPCSHEYHFRCVAQWLKFNHRCPICRSPMPWVQALLPAPANDDNANLDQSHARGVFSLRTLRLLLKENVETTRSLENI